MPVLNLRRSQLGRLGMYGLAFAVGYLTGLLANGVVGGLAFTGLFAFTDTFLEFAFGLLGDWREKYETGQNLIGDKRTRREARKATRAVRASLASNDDLAEIGAPETSEVSIAAPTISARPPRRRRRR